MGERGVTPVVGVIIVVAVAVILASVVSVYVFGLWDVRSPAPEVSVSHSLVEDGSDDVIAVTLEAGDAIQTDQLYVIGSKALDMGGPPGSSTPADETFASEREKFTEASGTNPPQVGIGDTWDAGETVYLDPVGSAEGVTVSIYWNTEPVEGVNPGTVEGDTSYEIAEFTV
jgi:flagellin-like protein